MGRIDPHYRQVEYMTWPRAMAISETLWNETDSRNWDFFIQRWRANLDISTG